MSATFGLLKINGAAMPGLTNALFDERESDDLRTDDGQLHVTSASVIRTAPMANFTTVAIRTLFGVLGTGDETPFAVLDGTNGIDMIAVEGDTVPGIMSGAVHARRQFLNGLLLLDKLSYRPGGVLEATCSAYAKAAAGGTDPVVRGTVTGPSIPLNTERLVLSSLSLGGTSFLRKLLSIDIDIIHQVENNDEAQGCYDGGLPYPVLLKQPGAGGAIAIKATIETLDTTTAVANGALVATWGVVNHQGVGIGATSATATLNTGLIRQRAINGPRGAAARRIEVLATFDGTNRPLTLSVV